MLLYSDHLSLEPLYSHPQPLDIYMIQVPKLLCLGELKTNVAKSKYSNLQRMMSDDVLIMHKGRYGVVV